MIDFYSSALAKKGFEISSIPSSGETRLTCVPRTTTSPNFLVSLVVLLKSSLSTYVRTYPKELAKESVGKKIIINGEDK